MAVPLGVKEIELGIAMLWDADGSGGNAARPADGDERGGQLVAVAGALVDGLEASVQLLALLVLHSPCI